MEKKLRENLTWNYGNVESIACEKTPGGAGRDGAGRGGVGRGGARKRDFPVPFPSPLRLLAPYSNVVPRFSFLPVGMEITLGTRLAL